MPEPSPSNRGPGVDWLAQLQQNYSQIKFGPGVVGKTTRAALALIAAWVAIIFRLGTDWMMNASLIFCGLAVTGVFFWWLKKTHNFAEKNPHVALMEGAQLIEYQKWEAAINGKSLGRGIPVEGPGSQKQLDVDES